MNESVTERQQLEQAIAHMESQRPLLGDAVVDAAIAPMQEKLHALKAAASPGQQRKLITILFMDFVGSTVITSGLDPEINLEVMGSALTRLADPVKKHNGRVMKTMGDGFMAAFGVSKANENDPLMAVRAGLDILETSREISRRLENELGISGFQVRVGINSGLTAIVGSEGEEQLSGAAVNLAARMESAAEPGTVLISYQTYLQIRGAFDLEPQEPVSAKGFAEPVSVYRVIREKARSFRTRRRGVEGIETRTIGRDAEMQLLMEVFSEVVQDRRLRMVTVIGEAGVGKSRLLYEFENWVDLQKVDLRLYRGRARLETRSQPFSLLQDLLAFRFAISDDDPADNVTRKLIDGFAEAIIDDDAESSAVYVGRILGYEVETSKSGALAATDPEQLRTEAQRHLISYFKGASSNEPLLILLEDIHWADESSLELIGQIMTVLERQPVFVIAAARPLLKEQRSTWMNEHHFHRWLPLESLTERQCRLMVAELLQHVDNLPQNISDLIVSRSEGNPFYVEELIKMMIEDGIIIKGDPSWRVAVNKLERIDLPATLSGVLQARIEGLPREELTILQQASVIGRVFWDSSVNHLNKSAGLDSDIKDISGGLSSLRTREMIYQREQSAFSDSVEHIFKHAVLRDVTYESVLLRLRRLYHAAAADWLLNRSRDQAVNHAGLIASHLEVAGKNDEAAGYYQAAGQEAAARFANEEAINFLSRALSLVSDDNVEQHKQLLLKREEIFNLQGRREEQQDDLDSLLRLAEEESDLALQAQVFMLKARFSEATGSYDKAIDDSRMSIAMAAKEGDSGVEAWAQFYWSAAALRLGDFEAAADHAQQCLDLAQEAGDRSLEGRVHNVIGNVASTRGDIEAARFHYEKRLEIAKEQGDRQGEGYALGNLGNVFAMQYDLVKAGQLYERNLAIDREIGDWVDAGFCFGNLSGSAIYLEQYELALEYAQQALEIAANTGTRYIEGFAYDCMGEALYGLKQYNRAQKAYQKAIKVREDLGQTQLALESRAGMARVLIAQEKIPETFSQVELVLQMLNEIQELDSGESLLEVYATIIETLGRVKDSRIKSYAEEAYDLLQATIAGIPDESNLDFFLKKPWNQTIIAAWEQDQSLS